MQLAPVTGGLAAVLSTISFVPQAVKIIRTRDTDSISTGMYVVTVAGFVLWSAYGALLLAWPILFSNVICMVLSGFILMMKLLPRPKKDELARSLESAVGADTELAEERGTGARRKP